MKNLTIALTPEQFTMSEKTLAQSADFKVVAWAYIPVG